MILRWMVACAAAGTTLLLAACGGGGGGSSSGSPVVAVTFAPRDVVANYSPGNEQTGEGIRIWVSGVEGPLWFGVQASLNALAYIEIVGSDLSNVRLGLKFKPVGVLPNGTHVDRIKLDICADAECRQPIAGSPFDLSATLMVSGSPATSVPQILPRPARSPLTHDVVAAAISQPMNALVMASALPDPALYLYDLPTGKERRVALSKAPTALALSLDGRKAAVGHDGRVTWVDLASMSKATPTVAQFDLPVAAFDLFVDGARTVHVFGAGLFVELHSIDVITGSMWTTSLSLFEDSRALVHPSGDSFYTSNSFYFERYLLAGDGLVGAKTSRAVSGNHAVCSRLWAGEAGSRIYDACGNAFVSSADAAQDMLYVGRLPVVDTGLGSRSAVVALADSARLGRIAFLDPASCIPDAVTECDTYLRLVDTASGTLLANYWPPPLGDEWGWYRQRGVFVGYAADGTLYMITRRIGAADASRAFYVSAPLLERIEQTGAARGD